MARIRIPHLNDNYYEIVSAIPSLVTVFDAAYNGAQTALEAEFRKEVNNAGDEADVQIALQILRHYQDTVAPRFLGYSYLLAMTSTIEKNYKVLTADGFAMTSKRKLSEPARNVGLLQETKYNGLDLLIDEMFELRNSVAHSFGTKVAEPKNHRVDQILKRHPELTLEWEDELFFPKAFLDQAGTLLETAYAEIAHHVYSH